MMRAWLPLASALMSPKLATPRFWLGRAKFAWLRKFSASARSCTRWFSLIEMFFNNDTSEMIAPGPMVMVRPALPNVYWAGAANDVWLKKVSPRTLLRQFGFWLYDATMLDRTVAAVG